MSTVNVIEPTLPPHLTDKFGCVSPTFPFDTTTAEAKHPTPQTARHTCQGCFIRSSRVGQYCNVCSIFESSDNRHGSVTPPPSPPPLDTDEPPRDTHGPSCQNCYDRPSPFGPHSDCDICYGLETKKSSLEGNSRRHLLLPDSLGYEDLGFGGQGTPLITKEVNAVCEVGVSLAHEAALELKEGGGDDGDLAVRYDAIVHKVQELLDLPHGEWPEFYRSNCQLLKQCIDSGSRAVMQGNDFTVSSEDSEKVYSIGVDLADHLVYPKDGPSSFSLQIDSPRPTDIDVINGQVRFESEDYSPKNLAAINVALSLIKRRGHGFEYRSKQRVRRGAGKIRKAVGGWYTKHQYFSELVLNMSVDDAVVFACRKHE